MDVPSWDAVTVAVESKEKTDPQYLIHDCRGDYDLPRLCCFGMKLNSVESEAHGHRESGRSRGMLKTETASPGAVAIHYSSVSGQGTLRVVADLRDPSTFECMLRPLSSTSGTFSFPFLALLALKSSYFSRPGVWALCIVFGLRLRGEVEAVGYTLGGLVRFLDG